MKEAPGAPRVQSALGAPKTLPVPSVEEATAFRDFLIATLQNGTYATLYTELYATSPPYRFFNSILFP
jgi:hypothetical protein